MTRESQWPSPFDQLSFLEKLKFAAFEGAARIASLLGLRIQARMNIDPRSTWHDQQFIARLKFGGLSRDYSRLPGFEAHDQVRYDMLSLLAATLNSRSVAGDVIEVGVGSGTTARLLRLGFPDRQLYLVDSLAGFGQEDREHEIASTGQRISQSNKERWNFGPAIAQAKEPLTTLIAKPIAEAVKDIPTDVRFALAHIDVDLYEPTKTALDAVGPRMAKGGFVVVHDYNAWAGARLAADNFLANRPCVSVPMPDKSGSLVIIVLQ